jgi:CotH protein
MRRTLLAASAALAALAVTAPSAQFGPGGPMGQERKVVKQFDKDGDNRLNLSERQAAREWLGSQPQGGPGGFGRRGGGPGGPFGEPVEPPAAGRALSPAGVKQYRNEPLYDPNTLRTIFLQFESKDWDKELTAFNNTDVEVPAMVTVDGRVYKDVGVHYRGASSFFMVPEGRKRSLNLSFNFVNKDQQLGGYRTLNLLNANGDPSLLRAVLYTHIASQYIPTPKMNFARVVINGESWGIYPNAQQFNRDFLRDFFKTTDGERWKVPGSPNGRGGLKYLGKDAGPYKAVYEIASADKPESWAALIKLTDVLTNTPIEKLESALAPILDIDGALKFLALETTLINSDGYFMRASDYSLYRDLKGQFHIVPHDVNEGMGAEEGGPGGRGRGRGFGGPPPGFDPAAGPPPGFPPPPGGFPGLGGPGGPGRGGRGFMMSAGPELDPLVGLDDTEKPLRSRLLAVPALRAKYLGFVREIAQKCLDWKTLGPIAQRYYDLIADDAKADTKKLASTEAFEAGLASLKAFADKRRGFLLENASVPSSR